ncbi:MAG: sodium:solute symporter family protein [Clostridiales bacterium]|nr:sodium:solute symporter family protein [Clostridiales bacterium]
MAAVDIGIVAAFLAFLFFFGSIFFKWVKNPDDFYVAGRLLPPFILAAVLTATNVNMYSFIGQGGKAYEQGISIVWHTWTGNMALVLAGLFILPILRRLEVRTIPEFLEARYGLGMRVLIAILWIFRLSFWLGIVLYTGATAAMVITGTGESSYLIWALVFSVITIIYTTAGGMWSVALTDVLQFSLMLLGALIFFPIIMAKAGGFGGIARALPSSSLELVPQTGQLNWTFILAIFLLGIQWASTDQGMLQRAFSGRDVKSVAKGLILSGIQTTPFALLWYLPGLAARAIDPAISPADTVIPAMLARFVPTGIFGIILCGLLSAQMSTISSNINSTATLFTSDIYQRVFKKRASAKQVLVVVRIVTLLVGFFMVGFSFFARKMGAVNAYLTVIGITDMPLFVVAILYGIFWKKGNWLGAVAGYLAGAVTGTLSIFVFFGGHQNASTYGTFLGAGAALVFTPVFSLLGKRFTQPERAEAIQSAWKPSQAEVERGEAFYLIPRSPGGRRMLGLCLFGLLGFLAGIGLGGLGLTQMAGWVALGSMVVYFAGGLLRLSYD